MFYFFLSYNEGDQITLFFYPSPTLSSVAHAILLQMTERLCPSPSVSGCLEDFWILRGFSVRLKMMGGWRVAKTRWNQDSSLLVTVCGGWIELHYTYFIFQFSLVFFNHIHVKICTFFFNVQKTEAVCLMHDISLHVSCISNAQGHSFSHSSVLWWYGGQWGLLYNCGSHLWKFPPHLSLRNINFLCVSLSSALRLSWEWSCSTTSWESVPWLERPSLLCWLLSNTLWPPSCPKHRRALW